jgi:hypothetical protein
MSKTRYIILSAVLLLNFTTLAQPGGKLEHDWILRSNETNWYGIYQATNYFPFPGRSTTVFFGQPLFTVAMRAETLLALTLVPIVGAALALTYWRKRTKARLRGASPA